MSRMRAARELGYHCLFQFCRFCFAMMSQHNIRHGFERSIVWVGYIWERSPTNEPGASHYPSAYGRVYIDGFVLAVNDD